MKKLEEFIDDNLDKLYENRSQDVVNLILENPNHCSDKEKLDLSVTYKN